MTALFFFANGPFHVVCTCSIAKLRQNVTVFPYFKTKYILNLWPYYKEKINLTRVYDFKMNYFINNCPRMCHNVEKI